MDILREIDRKILKLKATRSGIGAEQKEILGKKTGTTILALKYKNGIIMAADRRCVTGDKIFSDEMTKIEETDSLSCIAGAGQVSDFQLLVEILMNDLIPSLEKYWDVEIFVDGQANLIRYIMRNILLLVWPILAGWDPYMNKSRIFLFEPLGTKFEINNFIAGGSGEPHALDVLKKLWTKNCSKEEGIELAVEALLAASEADRNTSDPRLHSPLVKIISSKSITTLPPESGFNMAWEQSKQEQIRQGDKNGISAYLTKSLAPKRAEKNKKTARKKPLVFKEKKNDDSKP